MSVFRRSTFMGSQNTRARKMKATMADTRGGERRELLLAVAPVEILDHQHAQAAEQMHRQQKHKAALGELHQRLIAPAQKTVKLRLAVDGKPERQKMQRQKNRQRQPGKPMDHGGEPQRAAAMLGACRASRQHHGGNGARAERRQERCRSTIATSAGACGR